MASILKYTIVLILLTGFVSAQLSDNKHMYLTREPTGFGFWRFDRDHPKAPNRDAINLMKDFSKQDVADYLWTTGNPEGRRHHTRNLVLECKKNLVTADAVTSFFEGNPPAGIINLDKSIDWNNWNCVLLVHASFPPHCQPNSAGVGNDQKHVTFNLQFTQK